MGHVGVTSRAPAGRSATVGAQPQGEIAASGGRRGAYA